MPRVLQQKGKQKEVLHSYKLQIIWRLVKIVQMLQHQLKG